MNRGSLVVLEGIDGSGTTTQVELLVRRLGELGYGAYATREPSSGPVGSFIRGILTSGQRLEEAPDFRTMALLFAADRADHCAREIVPRLASGEIVVCDRYLLSSIVYQSATSDASGDAAELVRLVNREAHPADLTIVLDIDPRVAATRRARRGGQAELYEVEDLQVRLAALYEAAETLMPESRIRHVRGEPAVEEVAARILEATLEAIGRGK